ncbi:hypothetical protein SLNSH_20120 [Alsobacter soli]|uniref:Uncharacterized protein n=1 Tax=Alsobacter soli TaxID=2109933 RepID=A0A2T1HNK5_9HYPH|nr:hypothetical protein [Alsobacter soli]PSC03250.1 hypothetical protein SLNSH_20120 [Alsobacter soli]
MRVALGTAVFATALNFTPAIAADAIPLFDIDAICARRPSPQVSILCVKSEQDAYDFLKWMWDSFDEDVRRKATAICLKSAAPYECMQNATVSYQSYADQLRRMNEPTKFRP